MATQAQIEGALRRHAILSVAVERATATRQRIAPETIHELQRIEADINSILPVSAAGAIAAFQEQVKSDLLRMESQDYSAAVTEQRSNAQERIANLRDKGAKAATAAINDGEGRNGLNLRQMQDAMQHGKFKTTPREHARTTYVREVMAESGGEVDPKEFMAAWTKAFDAPDGSPTRERFLDSIGADTMDRADRARFFDQLSTEMMQTEMGARRDDKALEADKNAFNPRMHEVSGRDQLRLDTTAAMLKHAGKPGGAGIVNHLTDRVSDRSLTDNSGTGTRGDIAQAMAAHTGQRDGAEVAVDLIETHEAAASETLL